MKTYFITDQGQVRSINEDAGGVFYNGAGQVLAVVADGMGGHQAGEVASGLAVQTVEEKWKEIGHVSDADTAAVWLKSVLREANDAIFQRSREKDALEGMGTTVVLAVCSDEFVSIAHVGDSRAYLVEDGHLKRLTRDHSLVDELLRTGQITEQDAEEHPRKNVLLKALGTEEKTAPDVNSISWQKSNSLLLCSDGLTNKINDEELQDLFQAYDNHETLAKELAHIANERGGEDNITLTIVDHVHPDGVGDASC